MRFLISGFLLLVPSSFAGGLPVTKAVGPGHEVGQLTDGWQDMTECRVMLVDLNNGGVFHIKHGWEVVGVAAAGYPAPDFSEEIGYSQVYVTVCEKK
ncbi:MAG: hypothetical protein QF675_10090 [SAR324 cluster bacterium]|jgi:hypothetical protein|nr:hypothetical protein [SAR324 cluster bacterium]